MVASGTQKRKQGDMLGRAHKNVTPVVRAVGGLPRRWHLVEPGKAKRGSHPKRRGTASQEGTPPWAGMSLHIRSTEGRSVSPGGGRGGVGRLPLNPGVCPSGSISGSSSILSAQGELPPWAERACFVGGEEGEDLGGDPVSLLEIEGWLSGVA